ncbi:hypothetical protein [Sphingobacterium multivorum]|uniref:hypothetical protein n=1 Tax=Sphingobacterium multivorum TaxID=28454 RepID=UPI003DA4FE67
MRKFLIVGSRMGMTGCQLIRLQEASIILNVAALDLLHAVEKVKSDVEVNAFKEMTNLISMAGYAESDFKLPIKEKKPKYIRQQHKLAQRHYRRK